MPIENEREPWRNYGFTSVPELLARVGLPKDTLSTLGLLFEERLLRRAGTWTRLAHTVSRHVFNWPGNWSKRVVKQGHEQAFLDLLEQIRGGNEKVEYYASHVAAMRELSARRRAAKAARHAALVEEVRKYTAQHEPSPSEEEQEQAARFLERWAQAPPKKILYANGIHSLLDTDLGAGDRAGIIRKLKPVYFVERTHGSDGPYSGLWTFQRALSHQRIVVRMVLCLPKNGPPRCELFTRVKPGVPPPSIDALAVDENETGMRELKLMIRKDTFTARIRSLNGGDSGTLYSTTELDTFNLKSAKNRYRVLNGLPFPEDFERFREQYGSMYTKLDAGHLDAALGWVQNRWTTLETGALATEEEADIMRRLEQPRWLHEELLRQFPEKYAMAQPGRSTNNRKEELGRWDWKVERMVADEAAPDIHSGFARTDMQRLGIAAGMLAWDLAPTLEDFWRAVFLLDIKHYLLYGNGFTGTRYKASVHGPVVPNAEALLARLHKAEVVRILRTKYKGKEAQRVYAHAEYYPLNYTGHGAAGEIAQTLGLQRDTWNSSIVLRECQRSPLWAQWVAEGSFIPYDIAFSIRI